MNSAPHPPTLDPVFLALLRCPATGQPLSIAPDELIASVNRACGNRPPVTAGLLREDGRILYPVIDNLPVLLATHSIAISEPVT